MKTLFRAALVFFFLVMSVSQIKSQNSLNLQLADGSAFKVLLRDTVYNKHAQSQVLISDLQQDTLHLKVELESGVRYGLTFYLLNKSKKTSGKEFSYVLRKEKQRLRPVFLGMYDIQ